MPFCNMCGKEYKPGDLFCPDCGNDLSVSRAASHYAMQMPDPSDPLTEDFSSMSKEESIKLTEELGTNYHSLERMQKEISELVSSINSAANHQTKRYSAFRFFWPYLIYAAVACTIFYYLTGLTRALLFAPCIVIIPVIIIIVGGVKARRSREESNYDAANYAVTLSQRAGEQRQRLAQLTSSEASLRSRLEKYNGIVPVHMRNKSKMLYAKKMLEMDKAANFAEAMDMMSKKMSGASV